MGELYDAIGAGYGQMRRPDDRIRAFMLRALGEAATVLNVGAGRDRTNRAIATSSRWNRR